VTHPLDHLLAVAADEGIVATVTPDGRIKLNGPAHSLSKWKAALAPHKPAILERDLDNLIREAAAFWQYDADDLRLIRQAARTDPAGLRLALRSDPLHPYYQTETIPSPSRENPTPQRLEQPSCF
jgi:hypothetical protein